MLAAEEIHIFATVFAQDGKADELRAILTELVAGVKTEAGVVSYVLHEDMKKPGNFHFHEVYENQAAADAHMKSPHLAAAFAKAGAILSARPSITSTKVVAG